MLEGPVSLLQMAVRDVASRIQSFREVLPADEWLLRVEPAIKRLMDATVELLETVKSPYQDGGAESRN